MFPMQMMKFWYPADTLDDLVSAAPCSHLIINHLKKKSHDGKQLHNFDNRKAFDSHFFSVDFSLQFDILSKPHF